MASRVFLWRHGVGIILALCLAPLIYMALLDNRPPVRLHEMTIHGDLRPGGKAFLTFVATVDRDCAGVARRRIIGANGIIFEYEPLPTIIYDPSGARRRFVREFELPVSIATGEAMHDVQVVYYCNFVQRALSRPIIVYRPILRFVVQ